MNSFSYVFLHYVKSLVILCIRSKHCKESPYFVGEVTSFSIPLGLERLEIQVSKNLIALDRFNKDTNEHTCFSFSKVFTATLWNKKMYNHIYLRNDQSNAIELLKLSLAKSSCTQVLRASNRASALDVENARPHAENSNRNAPLLLYPRQRCDKRASILRNYERCERIQHVNGVLAAPEDASHARRRCGYAFCHGARKRIIA